MLWRHVSHASGLRLSSRYHVSVPSNNLPSGKWWLNHYKLWLDVIFYGLLQWVNNGE